MNLSPELAAELFAGNVDGLARESEGSAVNLGLPPYTPAQHLSVRFSRGCFGISARFAI